MNEYFNQILDGLINDGIQIVIESKKINPVFEEFCKFLESENIHEWCSGHDSLYDYTQAARSRGFNYLKYSNGEMTGTRTHDKSTWINACGASDEQIVKEAGELLGLGF